MKLQKNKAGFSLAEMMVSMMIIAVLLTSFATFITKFFEVHTNAVEFIDVQDETYLHLQIIKSIVKAANNILVFPYPTGIGKYFYDTLLIDSKNYSDAPFALVKAFRKSVDNPKNSISYLDEVIAANKGIDEEFYLSLSSLYLWSDVEQLSESEIIFSDPASGKIKIVDITEPKTETVKQAKTLEFQGLNFVMPTGITKINDMSFFISDRNDHTVWRVELLNDDNLNDKILPAERVLVLGKSAVAGALECENNEECHQFYLNQPNGLLYKNNVLFVADSKNYRVLEVTLDENQDVSAVEELIKNENYESGKSDSGMSADNFFLNTPIDIAQDNLGNIFVSDTFNHRIVKLTCSSTSSTPCTSWANTVEVIAGTGEKGFLGDWGNSKLSNFSFPTGLVFVEENNEQKLFVSDSGNNAVRTILLESATRTENFVFSFLGKSDAICVNQDLATELRVGASEQSENCSIYNAENSGRFVISRQKPPFGNKEVAQLISAVGTLVHRLLHFNEAEFYFNTGIYIAENGNLFLVDSLNNQIKVAVRSDAQFVQPSLTINLRNLQQSDLQNTVYPVVRQEDFGNYNFYTHALTGEKDYLSPFPLHQMFFKISGLKDKMLMANFSLEAINNEEQQSNNFQFSVGLRNEVEK